MTYRLDGPARWKSRLREPLGAPEREPGDARLLAGVRWTISFVAFLAYIFAITTYRLPIGSLAIIAGLAGLAIQSEATRFPWLLAWFAAFILWCALGYIESPYPQRTWDGLVELAKLWAIVLVGVNAIRSRSQIRFFTVFFVGCFALYPLRGAFANYFLYRYTVFGRAIWNRAFENPNDLAAFALLQLSMVAALLVLERRWWVKRCAQAGLILLPLLVLMTQSRGAFIGLAIFTICCGIGQWRRLRKLLDTKRRIRVVCVSLVAIAAVSYFAPDSVWQRLAGLKHLTNTEQLREVDSEGSARQRWEIWRVASKIIGEHPVFGVGVSAYPLAHVVYSRGEEFNPTAWGERDTHSTILNLLAETGVPGTIFFFCMVISVVVDAERARRQSNRRGSQLARPLFFLEVGLLGFFSAGTFGSFGYLSFLYIHLMLLSVTAEVTRRELGSGREVRGGLPSRRALRPWTARHDQLVQL
jgi:O-antigen ligase